MGRERGRSNDNSLEAARAAAYPPVFTAAMVGLLFAQASLNGEAMRVACSSSMASDLLDSVMRVREENRLAASAFCAREAPARLAAAQPATRP